MYAKEHCPKSLQPYFIKIKKVLNRKYQYVYNQHLHLEYVDKCNMVGITPDNAKYSIAKFIS